MFSFTEEFIEPFARYFRFREGTKEINPNKKIVIVDIGCGPQIRFYKFAKNKLKIKKYIGIDPLLSQSIINKYKSDKIVKLIKAPINKNTILPQNNIDYMVGFAFIEHVKNPKTIINKVINLIKKNGKIIFTSPTPRAKEVLEFLAYKLNLISRREIKEHKNYFDKNSFSKFIPDKINYKHRYFELGLNNLFIIKK